MVYFGPPAAEVCWRVWGTPANFNWLCILPSLLQRRRSPEANQTLHDVWPSHGLVQLYTFSGALAPDGILPGAIFTVYVQVLRSAVLAALLHGSPAAGVSQSLRRGTRNGITELSQRAPSSARRPSCWVSTHIVVSSSVLCTFRKQKMTPVIS